MAAFTHKNIKANARRAVLLGTVKEGARTPETVWVGTGPFIPALTRGS